MYNIILGSYCYCYNCIIISVITTQLGNNFTIKLPFLSTLAIINIEKVSVTICLELITTFIQSFNDSKSSYRYVYIKEVTATQLGEL